MAWLRPALLPGFITFFRRGFNRLVVVCPVRCASVTRPTITLAAIGRAVPPASSAAAAAAPFARAFPLRLLLGSVLRRSAFRRLLCCLVLFISGFEGRHDFL